MWEVLASIATALVSLAVTVATLLIGRWVMGLSTPTRDLRQIGRLFADIQTVCSGIWHKALLWLHDQFGFTQIRLILLKRKIDQGGYAGDVCADTTGTA